MFFAGDATSVDLQGYMEGGAFTGMRAADEVIAVLRGRAARVRAAVSGRPPVSTRSA